MKEDISTVTLKQHHIQVQDQSVLYQECGQGDPIILVHGLSGSTRWWIRNVDALAIHYHVYLVDLPGFGSMHRLRQQFALDTAASWLLAWMEAMEITRSHLIGHSMGGYICMRMASSKPEVVNRLVLVSPAGVPRVKSLLGYALPLMLAVRSMPFAFLPILTYDAFRAGPGMLIRATRDLIRQDVRTCLKEIVAPTLLLWGTDDALVPPAFAPLLRQEIPHAHLLMLKKAGHVGMFDKAEEFNTAVLAFLQGETIGE